MKRIGVMQLTNSLHAGGMERMAVNLANLVHRNGYRSYVGTTREEGHLAHHLEREVERLRLTRKRTLSIGPLRRLVAYIQKHQIDILHAHGHSLFIAGAASLFPPYPAVVWHDNDGNHGQRERPKWIYRLGTTRVSGVIAASEPLAEWSRTRLKVPSERVWFLPNFVQAPGHVDDAPDLPGVKDTRIVCVAGLRRQKDHLTLIRAMARVAEKITTAHLLIVGPCRDAEYHEQIKGEIIKHKLGNQISLLGDRQDIPAILQACRIGVLSSASEAFPLALMEYGVAGLPSVVTEVGECANVLDEGRAGVLVPPRSPDQLGEALLGLLRSPDRCLAFGTRLKLRINEVYGPNRTMERVSRIYDTVLGCSKRER